MQTLPTLRRREADTTSYVADYLTRSVRRASGLVLAGHPGTLAKVAWSRIAHQRANFKNVVTVLETSKFRPLYTAGLVKPIKPTLTLCRNHIGSAIVRRLCPK